MKWSYTHSFKSSPPHWGSAGPTVLQSLSSVCILVQETSSRQQCHQLDQLRSQRVHRQTGESHLNLMLYFLFGRASRHRTLTDRTEWRCRPNSCGWSYSKPPINWQFLRWHTQDTTLSWRCEDKLPLRTSADWTKVEIKVLNLLENVLEVALHELH